MVAQCSEKHYHDDPKEDNTFDYIDAFVAIEGLIVFGSVAAAHLHFKAAGKRLSKVAQFHLFHLVCCLWFFAFNLTYTVNEATERGKDALHLWCSRFQFSWYIGVELLFLIVWWEFARYWESVLATRSGNWIQQKFQRVRLIVILVLGILYIITYSMEGRRHCDCGNKGLFYYASEILLPVCLGIDAARLGMLCWKRVAEYSSSARTRACQSLYFFELALVLFMNPVIFYFLGESWTSAKHNLLGASWYLCEFFIFVIPSVIMVFAMWRRNYLTIAYNGRAESTSLIYDDDGHVKTELQIQDPHRSTEMHDVDGGGVENPLSEFA